MGTDQAAGLTVCRVVLLGLLRAQVTESRVQPPAVVDLVDEARKILRNIGEAVVGHRIDGQLSP